jgi:NTP pyrophosphatase (non-canonical NTP hydrolase)
VDFDTYQRLASRTANTSLPPRERLANCALGLVGEAGEIADFIKKHLYQGHPLDVARAMKELGDLLWYVQATCGELGQKMNTAAEGNIAKLEQRYPDGQFSPVHSQQRTDQTTEEDYANL